MELLRFGVGQADVEVSGDAWNRLASLYCASWTMSAEEFLRN